MDNDKARLDLLFRIIARKKRRNVDEDISNINVTMSRGFIYRFARTVYELDFINLDEYSKIQGRLWP